MHVSIPRYEELVLTPSIQEARVNVVKPRLHGSIEDSEGQRSLLARTWVLLLCAPRTARDARGTSAAECCGHVESRNFRIILHS